MSQLLIPNVGPNLVSMSEMRLVRVPRSEVAKNLQLEFDFHRENYFVESKDIGKNPHVTRLSIVDAITKFLF